MIAEKERTKEGYKKSERKKERRTQARVREGLVYGNAESKLPSEAFNQ